MDGGVSDYEAHKAVVMPYLAEHYPNLLEVPFEEAVSSMCLRMGVGPGVSHELETEELAAIIRQEASVPFWSATEGSGDVQ